MKVVVFIKRTPDTAAIIKPTPDGKDIQRENVPFIINPYDEFAVEEAIRLKESKGAQTVVMTVGGEEAKEQLRRALAMGIDSAVLIRYDRFWELAPHQIGHMVAEVCSQEKPDLVITGKLTIDDYTYALAPYLAQALGYNLATYVSKAEYLDGFVRLTRETDYGKETWEVPLPLVMSADRGLNEPRLPNMRGIMMARRKPIKEVTVTPPGCGFELQSFEPPPPKKGVKLLKDVDELIQVLKEEVKVL